MRVALMQPYLFPYLAYFQLIHAADLFIAYDDVQYIKGGWINRNRILTQGEAHLFSFSVVHDSVHLQIKERSYSSKFNSEADKFIRTLQANYKRAPYYNEVIDLLTHIFSNAAANIAHFNTFQLKEISSYLGISTPFVFSSEILAANDLKGEERVLHICKTVGATHYINSIGGQELYARDRFIKEGLHLHFLKSKPITYAQFTERFVPYLSVIDTLMFNSKQDVMKILDEYEMI